MREGEEGWREGRSPGPSEENSGLISLCRFAANLISGVLHYKSLLDR